MTIYFNVDVLFLKRYELFSERYVITIIIIILQILAVVFNNLLFEYLHTTVSNEKVISSLSLSLNTVLGRTVKHNLNISTFINPSIGYPIGPATLDTLTRC